MYTGGGEQRHYQLYSQHSPTTRPEIKSKLTLELKARANLGQLHIAVVGLPVHMVSGAKGGRAGVRGGRSSYRSTTNSPGTQRSGYNPRAQPMDTPEGDVVILVCKGDDPMAVFFGHREQVTKYVRDLGQREEDWGMPSLAPPAPSPSPMTPDSPACPDGRRSHE